MRILRFLCDRCLVCLTSKIVSAVQKEYLARLANSIESAG